MKSHMPMVASEFGDYNFHGYSVLKLGNQPDGNPSPYGIQATLNFASAKDFEAALGAKAEKVLGDIPNFSDKGPILMVGEMVGKS